MALIEMISEKETIGRIKEIYKDIEVTIWLNFVPNLYNIMASKSSYLDANGTRSKQSWLNQHAT